MLLWPKFWPNVNYFQTPVVLELCCYKRHLEPISYIFKFENSQIVCSEFSQGEKNPFWAKVLCTGVYLCLNLGKWLPNSGEQKLPVSHPWRLSWCQCLVNTKFLNYIDEATGWSSFSQKHETPKCYHTVGCRKGWGWAVLDGMMQSAFIHRVLGLWADTGCGVWCQTNYSLILGLLSGWKSAYVFSPVHRLPVSFKSTFSARHY